MAECNLIQNRRRHKPQRSVIELIIKFIRYTIINACWFVCFVELESVWVSIIGLKECFSFDSSSLASCTADKNGWKNQLCSKKVIIELSSIAVFACKFWKNRWVDIRNDYKVPWIINKCYNWEHILSIEPTNWDANCNKCSNF